MSKWSLDPVFDSYAFVIASAIVLLLLLLLVRHDRIRTERTLRHGLFNAQGTLGHFEGFVVSL